MFKRLFWLVVGAGFGFGMSFRVMRLIRDTVDRYRPTRLSSDVAAAFTRFGGDLRAALAEGRVAMHAREAELKADLSRRSHP